MAFYGGRYLRFCLFCHNFQIVRSIFYLFYCLKSSFMRKGVVAEWKFCSDSSFYVETRLQTAFVWKTRAISV